MARYKKVSLDEVLSQLNRLKGRVNVVAGEGKKHMNGMDMLRNDNKLLHNKLDNLSTRTDKTDKVVQDLVMNTYRRIEKLEAKSEDIKYTRDTLYKDNRSGDLFLGAEGRCGGPGSSNIVRIGKVIRE